MLPFKNTVASVGLLLLNNISFQGVKSECLPQCKFDGNDGNDCRDWGLVDGKFVPWYLGSRQCLDLHNIKISGLDAGSICASATTFVNDIQHGYLSSSNARLGLGVSEGGFFEQDSKNDNMVVLKNSITIGRSTYNCETSKSTCYNAMKPYFEDDVNGKKEMNQVCQKLYDQGKNDLQLEQSTLRGRLCMDYRNVNTPVPICNPLLDQLKDQMKQYPNKSCNSFQMGVGSKTPPHGCGKTSAATTVLSFKGALPIFTMSALASLVIANLYI
mmetsp:Transcript_33551/g.48909  ORF Transcript_33551/g.48909 Transcript_33551/m.48909 type:complete len:271 (-) Transcript_33551:25-837(-)